MSTIDLRDAFHTLRLAKTSQKYCGITPYYGSPTYHYLLQGMQTGFSSNCAWFFSLVFLFLILSCPKRALVGGIVVKGCASRSLLGSYIHQESI